ncbi:hypothetical protein ACYSNU_07145 [Enterococcus sp. LJL120]
MNNKEKEIIRELITLMENSNYQLDESSQKDFNHQAVLMLEKILEMDYLVPFMKI